MYLIHLVGDAIGYLIPGAAASLLYIVLTEVGLRIKNERANRFHKTAILVLGLYLTVIFALTVSPVYGFASPASKFEGSINLNPLQLFTTQSGNPLDFWGNILLFIPFGVLLVLLFNQYQRLLMTLFTGAGLSFLIELLQLFSNRSTDIDDIVLNTVGTLCGFFLAKLSLSLNPSLYQKVGVMRRVDGRYYRKHKDAGSLLVLTFFVLSSVFIVGFTKGDFDLHTPVTPIKNDPAITSQSAEIDDKHAEVDTEKSRKINDASSDIRAKNAYLWDVSSNTVLFEKNSHDKIAPASTAKMLTALTVLAYCDLDDAVKVGQEVERIAEDSSRAWLYPGYRLTIRQLLDALLVPSGNDAAFSLAVYTGRKICNDDTAGIDKALSAFITAMNAKAAEIGADESHFTTPDGYDAKGQYTTARDLACIAKAFYKSRVLRDIAASYCISDVWLSGQNATFNNTNELINPSSAYYYSYAVGLKSGTSEGAGCCLVSAAKIDDKLYLCVIMGSTEEGRWTDSLALYHAIEDKL